MERLTYRYGENHEYVGFKTKTRDGYERIKAADNGAHRLADYEDTGLLPQDITALAAQLQQAQERVKELEEHNEHLIFSYEEFEAATAAKVTGLEAENAALREKLDYIQRQYKDVGTIKFDWGTTPELRSLEICLHNIGQASLLKEGEVK